jgi:hypothetical protein
MEYSICKYLALFITVWGAVFAVCSWVPCVPLAAYWDFSITGAKCWGFGARNDLGEFTRFFVSQAITSSMLDLIVFIIPVRLYFRKSTPQRTRIALLCLFALGLACVVPYLTTHRCLSIHLLTRYRALPSVGSTSARSGA